MTRAAVAVLSPAQLDGRNSSVVVGRDALGNVFVTGDGNTIEVKLTVVVADHRLRAAAESPTLQNPYRGLDAFRETDSALFFGRDDLKTRVWARFHALQRGDVPRLLPVLGASGSGKSSLVRAGLLPELVRQPMEEMRNPTVLVLRPGADPMQRLADVLARLAPRDGTVPRKPRRTPSPDIVHDAARSTGDADHRMVIFVDQLEELFTECTSEVARSAFLATLAHAAAQPDGLVSVVFAMRNDFADSLRTHDAFATAVRERPFRVSQMSTEQLIDAIAQPAQVLGHPWPNGLVENLVLQCEGRAGALPLLQFALKRLWSEHVAGRLAESRWSSRLIEDFVVQVAETIYEGSGAGRERDLHQRIIRRAFVAMVQLGEGAADTRRVARLSEIVARRDHADEVRAVLASFAAPEARLITVSEAGGEPTYELTHEVLIGSWDRLSTWLGNVADKAHAEAIRSGVRLRRRLAYAANAWHRKRDALWRPPELELAEKLRDQQAEELSTIEHTFLDASRTAVDAEGQWRRRAKALGIAATVAFVGVVSVLGLAAWRRGVEARELLAAVDMEQGRALLLAGHPMKALPYFVAARAEGIESPVLRMWFARASNALPRLTIEHGDVVNAAAFSPDGARVVTASSDHTARVWDARTGQPTSPALEHGDAVNAVAFSPDGARIVTASSDHTARVWDARTGRPVGTLQHGDSVNAVAFSPDGARVVTASSDDIARIWDARTGELVIGALTHPGAVSTAAFSPDGDYVVTASDKKARIWDARTGRLVTETLEHGDSIWATAFSPDSARVVTASADGTAQVWDAHTGKPVTQPLDHRDSCKSRHPGPGVGDPLSEAQPASEFCGITAAAFSPDGTRVVTSSYDNTARVWDARTGKPVTQPLEHRSWVFAAAFSPDGAFIVTASHDHTARVWDARTGKPVTEPLEHRAPVIAAAFSRNNASILTASWDRTARVWDARTSRPVTEPLAHPDAAIAAFSPDGACLITASHNAARVWNARTGESVTGLLAHRDSVTVVAFSPDGARVITASADGTARVWDARTGNPVTEPLEHPKAISTAAFSPDGARVITVSDHAVRVWDARTGRLVTASLVYGLRVNAAAFSPDGARVVTASADHTARVWDARTGEPVTGPLEHEDSVTAAAFSPDGARIVTVADNTARVWDAHTGKPVTALLKHRLRVNTAAFSPDGARVATASNDRTARIWDARTGKPVTEALEHDESVTTAAFSPDGASVVTASADRTARIWDARTGKPATESIQHHDAVTAATFGSDGASVVTVSNNTARVWDLPMAPASLGVSDWQCRARCAPFVLENDILVENHSPCPVPSCPP